MNVHVKEISPHPAAELFPMLDDARLAELAADIRENGLREPIQILDGQIIDGRNRHRACEMAGVTPQFRQVAADANPWALVWSLNGQRRDLTAGQRHIIWKECAENDAEWQAEQKRIQDEANKRRSEAAASGKVGRASASSPKPNPKPEFSDATTCGTTKREGGQKEGAPKGNSKPQRTSDAEAKAANVDRGTVEKNNWLRANRDDLYQKVKSGELTSNKAWTQAKREEKKNALEDISAQEVKAAQGLYDVIVLDPPWQMEKIEREVAPNQAAFDYPTMDEDALTALEIPAADDCHVWVWTTHKHLPMSLRLIKAWGLKYVCTFVWHKPGGFQPYNLPQFNCEFAIYCRKGAPQFIDLKAFPVCFNAPRGEHSEKPEEFYEIVRRVTGGRRLDMFNRRKIEGFDGWGNEAAE